MAKEPISVGSITLNAEPSGRDDFGTGMAWAIYNGFRTKLSPKMKWSDPEVAKSSMQIREGWRDMSFIVAEGVIENMRGFLLELKNWAPTATVQDTTQLKQKIAPWLAKVKA